MKKILYKISQNELTLYTYNIEFELKKETTVDIIFDYSSVKDMTIKFFFNSNITFNNVRKTKKFLLYNIPHIKNVIIGKHYSTIVLTKDFGLLDLRLKEFSPNFYLS
jgi:hypothetical protein